VTPTDQPCIEAVSLSPRHGFSKSPQRAIRLIAGEGVEGDAHRGVTTQHLYRMHQNPTQPNLCQVHLFSRELLEEFAARGHIVAPGAMGENVLTTGLDLLALPLGTVLHLGPEAVVEVTGLRTPCSKIDRLQPGLQQHCWGPRQRGGKRARRAGIMSIVRRGGLVGPGDTLMVVFPPEPWQPLPPV
jgi:MOSC domain-containing protein YiiM